MDDIRIRSWLKSKNTPLNDRELVYVRSEKALYIKDKDEIIKVGTSISIGDDVVARVADLETKISEIEETLKTIKSRLNI